MLLETTASGLGDSLRGEVLVPGSPGYDAARRVWNGAIDRRPACIARCAGVADVVAAVRFARDHDLEVAVRGGGHNVAGTAVCDGGLVIDLSAMRAVWVDPVGRRRHRLPDAQARAHRRQPLGGRGGHRRRHRRPSVGGRAPRSALGAAGRRRQLRRRHLVPVRAAPRRPDRAATASS
jgi:hypothetical protein